MEFTECEFEPAEGDRFYFPDFVTPSGCNEGTWGEWEMGERIKKLFGVYRTKEQAIEKARKLGWLD